MVGVGGTGVLSDVESLSDSQITFGAYCAVLISGEIVCWGYSYGGQLGNGNFAGSDTPVQVVGVGGTGILSDASNVLSDEQAFCATVGSGGVDCWGQNLNGELGNGTRGTFEDSASPVQVEGVDGTGTVSGLSGVVTSGESFCAVLSSGGVTCWGGGENGQLGNGVSYSTKAGKDGSDVPVLVASAA